MSAFLSYSIVGLVTGCIYALTATGLVVTYTTSGIFNFAHGAIGMMAAFSYWQLTIGWGWAPWIALPLVLLVGAPVFGGLVERILIRPLHGAAADLSIGIAMRGVVDDPDLAAMAGASPARVQQLSWAMGAMLAALAGILLAPLVTL